ncbi:MAG: Gmad2 immunoglobulin-like domain-containing protein [Candidatus Paceibacterota bacterium]|jgi:hypothetical protein
MQNNFFGSKLNTALLFILIILMIVALLVMFENKETYFPFWSQNQEGKTSNENELQVFGNKDDLVFLSVLPNQKVRGVVEITGSVKGGYFFEGNILINVLGKDKNLLQAGNGNATSEWMTAGPVSFKTTIDFSTLPKGPAYIEVHNDNASGLPENDKSILIPITIE